MTLKEEFTPIQVPNSLELFRNKWEVYSKERREKLVSYEIQ